MIVLVGFMGAGKSTVGRLLAEKLGGRFVDVDERIAQTSGRSIREMFEAEGEEVFRRGEVEAIAALLTDRPGVLALGGGALGDEITRAALSASEATVVHLDVSVDEAMARIGDDAERPMLARSDLATLAADRRVVYLGAADLSIAVDGRDAFDIARSITQLTEIPRVDAMVAGVKRPVYVGSGSCTVIASLPVAREAEKVFVVSHPTLETLAARVSRSVPNAELLMVPEGETSKTLGGAAALYERLSAAAAHRHDLIIGVGGGVVTDLAAFVASTYNRGMPVVHTPTTLLGMVDAAIGGKTGVNLPAGKNLVGTFHQPSAVVCDTSFLSTLPAPEFTAGLAEVAKYGFISEPRILDILERGVTAVHENIEDIVLTSARIKCNVVAHDERESGPRETLNYGHTFAHAIEVTSGYGSIRHGEAVSLGMMAAAHLAAVLGRLDETSVDRHRGVLEAVGLPVRAFLDIDELDRAWVRDKKYRGGVRFVLLSRLGHAETGIVAPRGAVKEALERLAA
ncbi:MAG: 3-dehydroquinate synthase [Actinobacteria bacterium]|nr:3-dehydroquinate synthase [Actinomycetota bacterium]